MLLKTPVALLVPVLLCGLASSQQSAWNPEPAPVVSQDPEAGIPSAIGDWRSPIHTAASDPHGGAYGIWASGPDYKVSFHDGFCFYPCLGEAYPENLPLHWQTERISAGGAVFLEAGDLREEWRSEWRYEYRYPGLTEAYDVLQEGVEQTFTLYHAPPRVGDLVVTGRIRTPLRAAPMSWAHAPLTLADEAGNPIVSYGKALAYDALGREIDVETSFDGAWISLRLDGAWLDRASYPVTIDPLTSNRRLITWGGPTDGRPSMIEVARDDESDQLLVVYSRASSATDHDTWGRLYDDDFVQIGRIFDDITTSWSTRYVKLAFVGGADRWVIAMQRTWTSAAKVRVYLHDMGNTTLNSGTTLFHQPPSGVQHSMPDIGGTAGYTTGNDALLVYEEDISSSLGSTRNTEVMGLLVDAAAGTFGTPFTLDTVPVGTTFDRQWPSVNQISDGGTASWIVTWEEYNRSITNDDWDAYIARIAHDGSRSANYSIGQGGSAYHTMRPKVEGRDGRYLASFAVRDNTIPLSTGWGREIQVQRIDWPETSSSPVRATPKAIASSATDYFYNGWTIGYDSNSRSHWTIGYHDDRSPQSVYVERVGHTGNSWEQHRVYSAPVGEGCFTVSVTFNDDNNEYPFVWVSTEGAPTVQPVYGARLQYDPSAINVPYGTGCQGSISASRPFGGSEFFTVYLRSGLASAPSALLLNLGRSVVPLGGGCFLNLDPFQTIYILCSGSASASGAMECTIPLPDEPYVYGDLYLQWLQLDRAGMFKTTRGLRSQIRP